jgi:hypothetical protein
MGPKRQLAGTFGGTGSTLLKPEGEQRAGHAILSGVDHQFVDLANILLPAIYHRRLDQ